MKKLVFILVLLFSFSVFAEAVTELEITHPESKTEMQSLIRSSGTSKHVVINSVINYLKALKAGGRNGKFDLQVGGGDSVAATGSYIFTGLPTVTDTCVVAGKTFTVVAEASTPVSHSQFKVGTTAAGVAANLAVAVNANSIISVYLTATSSGSTTTMTSDNTGEIGNFVTITESLDNCTVSGAVLSGGVNKTANEYKFGY